MFSTIGQARKQLVPRWTFHLDLNIMEYMLPFHVFDHFVQGALHKNGTY